MKKERIIAKALLIMSLFAVLPFIFSQDNYAYVREKSCWILKKKSLI